MQIEANYSSDPSFPLLSKDKVAAYVWRIQFGVGTDIREW